MGDGGLVSSSARGTTGLCWLCVLLFVASGCSEPGDRAARSSARYEVVVESAARRPLTRGLIWLSLPSSRIAEVDALEEGIRIVEDGLGNRQAALSFEEVPVAFERSYAFDVQWPLPSKAGTGDEGEAAVPPQFVAPEPGVQSDAPAINDQLEALRGASPMITAANIHGFVSEAQVDAAATSTDRLLLSLALLRAANIPARAVAGIIDDGDGRLAADEMQLWVECFAEDRWRPLLAEGIDPLRAVPFRIFAQVDELDGASLLNNFYRGAGLRIKDTP